MNNQIEFSRPNIINWDQHKDKLKVKYPKLTENDLDFKEGKMDEMLGRLQIKLGKTRKELYRLFTTL